MQKHHSIDTRNTRVTLPHQADETARQQALRVLRLQRVLQDARVQTHIDLARRLHLTSQGIARLAQQTDLYISTLQHCLADLGSTLEIVVHSPDGRISCSAFMDR